MTRRLSLIIAAVSFTAGHARHAHAQLTLAAALREADHAAFPNRVAAGNASGQAAQRLAPLSGILPTVRVEAGYLATNDPIGVFGSTLRQRAITTANFDPERLESPRHRRELPRRRRRGATPVERRRMDGPARGSCSRRKRATRTEEWTRLSTRVDVVRAYYAASARCRARRDDRISVTCRARAPSQAEAMVRQGARHQIRRVARRSPGRRRRCATRRGEGAVADGRRQLAVLLGRRRRSANEISHRRAVAIRGAHSRRPSPAIRAPDRRSPAPTSMPRPTASTRRMPMKHARARRSCRASTASRATTGTRRSALLRRPQLDGRRDGVVESFTGAREIADVGSRQLGRRTRRHKQKPRRRTRDSRSSRRAPRSPSRSHGSTSPNAACTERGGAPHRGAQVRRRSCRPSSSCSTHRRPRRKARSRCRRPAGPRSSPAPNAAARLAAIPPRWRCSTTAAASRRPPDAWASPPR